MTAFKWAAVALLIGSGAAVAQGTQQSIPNGYRGGTSGAEPIGKSGAPVATGSYNYSPGPPAKSYVIIAPRQGNRRR